ncbi:hypothetical protein AWB81_00924 [Caballeronia arationis]|jgi:hypothetical protein|uniref:Zinc-ribbon domain-containing protein n=1 Tax=Caballeronia arationis TaxID=1777142 RepID=A0A7Z7N533_9BURK|nr:hypothetical protein [Caballeronia arationis]SAK51125.1 hypothetical protein AWB81_00924 [Caballeronia arationis]SOE82616.1 hypothetical protein SAMN05446927_5957 [Caballeronia arationis]
MDHKTYCNQFSETVRERRALMEQAGQYREARAERHAAQAGKAWDCTRGHAWDDTLSATQNVRCMNCASQRRETQTQRLQEFAALRGGALLSESYVDAATPLRWQCAFGHVWEARPAAIDREWCPDCVRERVYDTVSHAQRG